MTLVVHVSTRFIGGGSERTLADVVHALPAPDFEHVVIVGRDHDPARMRSLLGETRSIVVPTLIRTPHPIRDARAYAGLRRILSDLRPDVLHTIQSKAGILGRAAGRRAGVPTLVHGVVMSNFGPGFSPIASPVYRAAERAVARWTTAYIACGLELEERFVRAGIGDRARYTVIRSSVDLDAYRAAADRGRAAAREAIGLPSDRPVVLFAGALERRKGIDDLPAFVAELRRALPDAMLVVAGTGPLRERMEGAFRDAALAPAFRYVGYCDRMPELMAACDCLVMLSSAEGLATVLVQAAAARRPFVSYAVDGPGELIGRGAAGSIVPRGAPGDAARETARLIAAAPRATVDLSEWEPAEVASRYRAFFDGLGRRSGEARTYVR
jgi:glycosyltransferase involved in cell wall biosynthesis